MNNQIKKHKYTCVPAPIWLIRHHYQTTPSDSTKPIAQTQLNLHYTKLRTNLPLKKLKPLVLMLSGVIMTIIEIERVFLCFSNQLQLLKDRYPNTALTNQITNIMVDVQIIKLEVMRMNSINGNENKQLTKSVSQHIHTLQKRIAELKQSVEIITFDA